MTCTCPYDGSVCLAGIFQIFENTKQFSWNFRSKIWDLLLRSYMGLLFRIGFIFRVKFEDVIVSGAKFEYFVLMWV
jgi:hypothetical protein